MSTVAKRIKRQSIRSDSDQSLPPLEPGDHLDQKTFHARYEAMPEDVKSELIGGVVYMQASLKRGHGRTHGLLMCWLYTYESETPGVEAYDNVTTIAGEDSEPQPDACMVICPDKGGQMQFTEDDYLSGAAEFVGEVASSTESYDLHSKKRDYERAGVREYLVVALRQREIFWFVNRDGTFEERTPAPDGFFHSEAFPGLWLDPKALLTLNSKRLLEGLRRGINSEEHDQFVQQLGNR